MHNNSEITLPDEFASTMQQLVAEAEKTIPPRAIEDVGDEDSSGTMRSDFEALSGRFEEMERTVSTALEKLAAAIPSNVASQMQKMDEHMVALRKTESVNQRLFDSLHQELKEYRDNFLRDSLQKPFIRDLVVLFDDLSTISGQMTSAENKKPAVMQWAANLENSLHSLLEILHRMEVTEIESKDTVDRSLHRVVSYEPADFAEEDGRIVMRVKRGFLWRGQVLRPEEVVAKRFN